MLTIASDSPRLWDDFGDYMLNAYAATPERHAGIKQFHQSLLQNRSVALSLVEVRNEITGRVFEAYKWGNLRVCTDPAVIALPHPPQITSGRRTDLYVSIWVHDFGLPDEEYESLYRSKNIPGAVVVKYSATQSPYLNRIHDAVQEHLDSQSIYGFPEVRDQYLLNTKNSEVRFAQEIPTGHAWHRDAFCGSYDAEQRPDRTANYWHHSILNPICGSGTLYRINDTPTTRFEVQTVPGMISSHLGCDYNNTGENITSWGVEHRAVGNPEGRSTLSLETRSLNTAIRYCPWQERVLKTAPGLS
jgi:hypothetical protein